MHAECMHGDSFTDGSSVLNVCGIKKKDRRQSMKKLGFLCMTVLALLLVCCAAAEERVVYGDMLRAELYLEEGEHASLRVPIITNLPVKSASYDLWYDGNGEAAESEVKEETFIDGEHVETGDGWYSYDLYLHFIMGNRTESISRIAVKIDGELYDLYPASVELNLYKMADEPILLRMGQIMTIPSREETPFECGLYAEDACTVESIRFGAGQTVKELKINGVVYPDPEHLNLALEKDTELNVEAMLDAEQGAADYGSTFFQMEAAYRDAKDGAEYKLYTHFVSLTSFVYEERLEELKTYLQQKEAD